MKRFLRAFVRNKQSEFFSRMLEIVLDSQALVLFDLGAEGAIQPRWNRVRESLHYVGFEPDVRSIPALMADDQGCRRYEIVPSAIGRDSESILNLCRDPRVSSLLTPNWNFVNVFPNADRFSIVERKAIEVNTLDSLNLPRPDFIKLDVQGSELAVLSGAENALDGCFGLEIEVELLPIYFDQPLFGDLSRFLAEKDFVFIDFTSLNRWGRQKYDGLGTLVFGDALFLRTPESEHVSNLDANSLKRYLAICLIYSRFDLIDVALKQHADSSEFHQAQSAISKLRKSFNRSATYNKFTSRLLSYLFGIEKSSHMLY